MAADVSKEAVVCPCVSVVVKWKSPCLGFSHHCGNPAMASGLGYGSFPFPDSGKQSEDIPAADFSTDSPELWKEPEALSTRNSGKDRMEPFSQ